MSLSGAIDIAVIQIPLKGKGAVRIAVTNPDGTPFVLDASYTYAFAVSLQPDSLAPLFTLGQGSGLTLVMPLNLGLIDIVLTAPQIAMLDARHLFGFSLTISNLLANVLLINAGRLLPMLEPVSNIFSTASSSGTSGALSTAVINTLVLAGEAGGTGYLDGIATVAQAVNCVVQFLGDGVNPVQWILETSTAATNPGILRRPLDYSLTNTKVWRRIM